MESIYVLVIVSINAFYHNNIWFHCNITLILFLVDNNAIHIDLLTVKEYGWILHSILTRTFTSGVTVVT